MPWDAAIALRDVAVIAKLPLKSGVSPMAKLPSKLPFKLPPVSYTHLTLPTIYSV